MENHKRPSAKCDIVPLVLSVCENGGPPSTHGILENATRGGTTELYFLRSFCLVPPCQFGKKDLQWQPRCDDFASWCEQIFDNVGRQVARGWAGRIEETVFASGNVLKVQWSNISPQVALAWQACNCSAAGVTKTAALRPLVWTNGQREKVCRIACLLCGGIAAELLLFVLISGNASLRRRVLELGDTNSGQCYLYYCWLLLMKELPFVQIV